MSNQYTTKTGERWTTKRIALAKKILGAYSKVTDSLLPMSKEFGFKVTRDGLRCAIESRGELSPSTFVGRDAPEPGENLKRLYQLAKVPVKFSELCDKLDMSPARVKKLIDEAWGFGMALKVTQDHIGIESPVTDDRVQDTGIAPTVGERQIVGVISDTHLGSKYCLREQLKEFVNYAYNKGVREILHPGDWLDGDYRHGKFEMSHMGLSEQTRDLFETLPRLKGLTYHGITGNHDWTFSEESGVSVGDYITNYFEKHGRKDVSFYGDRGAFISMRGILIELWHPSGGVSYAVSYKMQKKIESYSPGMKAQLCLIGHWHRMCYIRERGVHALACGTFQGGQSAFAKSLTSGAPAIGGTILSWDLTKDKTMRAFAIERRDYFEKEMPHQLDPVDLGIAVKMTKA